MKKKMAILIALLACSLYWFHIKAQSIPTTTEYYFNDIVYLANENKKLQSEQQFLQTLSRKKYTEYKKDTLHIRKKLLYKDMKSVLPELGPYRSHFSHVVNHPRPNIAPYRQIYVFISVRETTKQNVLAKYAIFDAETGDLLAKSSGKS